MIVALEGPSGAGKTTCCALLARRLSEFGLKTADVNQLLSADGIASRIKNITHPTEIIIPAREELLLYAIRAARKARLAAELISTGKAHVVLLDRYTLSIVTFFRYVRQMGGEEVSAVLRAATGEVEPNVTILLGADLGTLLARTKGQQRSRKSLDFERYFATYWLGFRQELNKVPGKHLELDTTNLTSSEVVDRLAGELLKKEAR